MSRLMTALVLASLLGGPSLAAGPSSCTTVYDRVWQRYVTRCPDGRQYESRYDRTWDRWQTCPMPPWKPLEKGKR
jgi:hypothetical protein